MTFVMFRTQVSVGVDDFPDPGPNRALPPEQVEQDGGPLTPLRHVEHPLEGGEGARNDAHFLALLVDRAVVLRLGGARPRDLDQRFRDGCELPAEPNEARDSDGAAYRRSVEGLPRHHEQVLQEQPPPPTPGPEAVPNLLDQNLRAQHFVALTAQMILGHVFLPGLGVGKQLTHGRG